MSFQPTGPCLFSQNPYLLQDDIPQKKHPRSQERAFLPSFFGSLTIEASLALPVFLFFSVCIIHFLILLYLQADIQIHLEETARDLGKIAYTVKDSESASLAAINAVTIRSKILDEELSEHIEHSAINGGVAGFFTGLSSYERTSGSLDIIATYTYAFPFLPAGIGNLHFRQKCSCRAWIGLALNQNSANEDNPEETEGKTVYITPTGNAYHLSASCPYLDLSITSISSSELNRARNRSGRIYGKCSCADSGVASYYVTGYGILYHSDLNCSRLKRTVMAVDISEVGTRHQCPKCGTKGE